MQESLDDVAISFLAKDEPIARELYAKLEQTLKVFYFPRKQEELAGTDGLESMRTPFLKARIVVVLFRNPWGETPWTRVEEAAIKDRCLNAGWNSLVFVNLDTLSPKPIWVPDTHIRFYLQEYPLEELVGAIKLRVQEHGGSISKPDPLAVAKRLRSEADLRQDESKYFWDFAWIQKTVRPQVNALLKSIADKAHEIGQAAGIPVEAVAMNYQSVLRVGSVSIHVHWHQRASNVIDDAELRVTDIDDVELALASPKAVSML